jgi:hypothetical protein
MMQRVTAEFENATVLDTTGKSQRLGELWREQSVALVFLRHYG